MSSWKIYEGYERTKLINEISVVGDINPHDGIMSESEWAQVYKEIGKSYNRKNPLPLANSEMKKYLNGRETSTFPTYSGSNYVEERSIPDYGF